MRILGFEKHWPKLDSPMFTTFRLPRKDADKGRDWKVGEIVQIVIRPRQKDRQPLCTAQIIRKDMRDIIGITDTDARVDGFPGGHEEMWQWLSGKYHLSLAKACDLHMNRLTLKRQGVL